MLARVKKVQEGTSLEVKTMSRSFFISTLIFLLVVIAGCSGAGSNPVTSDPATEQITVGPASVTNNRYLLGYGDLYLDTENLTIEAVPNRSSEFHFNITEIITTCDVGDCFFVDIPGFTPEGDIDILFRLTSPAFNTTLTGFDIRGIFIMDGDFEFPEQNLKWGYYGANNYSIVNADGYSTLWCPVLWPMDKFHRPLFEYYEGEAAITGYNATGTLNPYKEFYSLPERHALEMGAVVNQHYYFRFPPNPGAATFNLGYAFDCGYNLPNPVQNPDVPEDFPPDANALEAYKIEADITGAVTQLGGQYEVDLRIYDWQGTNTIGEVLLEAPDIFNGTIVPTFVSDQVLYAVYHATIPNQLSAPIGSYPLLVSSRDLNFTAIVGYTVQYQIFFLDVVEPLNLVETVDMGGFSVFEGFYNPVDLTCWFSPLPLLGNQKFIGINENNIVVSGFPSMMTTAGAGFCEATQEFYCATSMDDPGWIYDVSVLNIPTKAVAHSFDIPSVHGFDDTIPLDFKADETAENIWFSMYAEDQVGVVSAGTLEPDILRFDVGDGPTSLHLVDDTNTLYIACELDNSIWALDTDTHDAQVLFSLHSDIEVSGQPVVGMAFVPDNHSLYVVGHFSGTVDYYDLTDNSYGGSIKLNNPNVQLILALKYDPVSGYLIATGQDFSESAGGSIYMINPVTNELVYTADSTGYYPSFMGLDTVHDILYVPDPYGVVDIFEIAH